MEPIQITPALVQQLHYLPSADRQVLHRNRGRYLGAEWGERGWFVEPGRLLLADSPAQWQRLHRAQPA